MRLGDLRRVRRWLSNLSGSFITDHPLDAKHMICNHPAAERSKLQLPGRYALTLVR